MSLETNESENQKNLPDMKQQNYGLMEMDISLSDLSIGNLKTSTVTPSAKMRNGNTVLIEINCGLWDRGLETALSDITYISYPHISVVQKLINCVMNPKFVDIGLATCFFKKLILFHPPKTANVQNYYWSILNDKYLMLKPAQNEENNLFWCLNEVLMTCISNEDCLNCMDIVENSDHVLIANNGKLDLEDSVSSDQSVWSNDWIADSENAEGICFQSHSVVDQLRRVLIVLEFVYNILEIDFIHKRKLSDVESVVNEPCFLSNLLWENAEESGSVNNKIRKLICIWFTMEEANLCHFFPFHRKLMMLLADIIHSGESAAADLYLITGDKSNSFAHEVSLKFNNCLKKNMTAIRMLKPHWLRMMVCSKLLCRMTGKTCPPELKTACDLLEYFVKVRRGYHAESSKRIQEKGASRKRREEINFGDCYCMCKLDDLKRAKLSFENCQNSCNNEGWTALHEAVLNGHEACVELILKESEQSYIDVRRQGVNGFTPLMCAVVKNHPEICRILLQHSGRELMTDVDADGLTVLDLCQNEEVSVVLASYDKNFSISAKDITTAVDLCVQMVESYFIAHRTYEIWKCRTQTKDQQLKEKRVKYEIDIQTNIDKLLGVVSDVIEFTEMARLVKPLRRILNIKNC